MMFRSMIRPLSLALSLAFVTAAAGPAFAGEGAKNKTEHREHGKGDKKHTDRPIDATKFAGHVADHLAKAKERLTNAMKKNGVAAATQTAVLKEFDTGAVAVQDAAKAAAKDGTVTADEAKQVRTQAKTLRQQLRDKYLPKAAKKDDKGKDKSDNKGAKDV